MDHIEHGCSRGNEPRVFSHEVRQVYSVVRSFVNDLSNISEVENITLESRVEQTPIYVIVDDTHTIDLSWGWVFVSVTECHVFWAVCLSSKIYFRGWIFSKVNFLIQLMLDDDDQLVSCNFSNDVFIRVENRESVVSTCSKYFVNFRQSLSQIEGDHWRLHDQVSVKIFCVSWYSFRN